MRAGGGFTLVELLVMLLVVGIITAVITPALVRPGALSPDATVLPRARALAIRAESSVVARTEEGRQVRFLPDGRVIAEHQPADTALTASAVDFGDASR